MSKLQRDGQLTGRSFAATPCPQEDEMYEVAYTIEVLRLCRICKHHHGQIYGGVELVCAVHPYGYRGNSCPDYQASKKLHKPHPEKCAVYRVSPLPISIANSSKIR